MDHIFFIHLPVEGHLSSFHILAIVDIVAMNIGLHMALLFTYLWNIKNSMEDIRRRKGKMNGEKSKREMNHERLWTPRNKLRVWAGG